MAVFEDTYLLEQRHLLRHCDESLQLLKTRFSLREISSRIGALLLQACAVLNSLLLHRRLRLRSLVLEALLLRGDLRCEGIAALLKLHHRQKPEFLGASPKRRKFLHGAWQ